MSLESNVRRMAGTRPFDLLPREAVQLIAFSCERRMLKAGETLFNAGEPADSAYFVLSGELSLAIDDAERRVEPGALVGETALLAEVVRRASAKATEDSELLRIPGAVFRRVLSEFPRAAVQLRAAAVARARELVNQLDETRARLFES
ncbi:MAG: cyclic nucleotide-binding domain-containing protein [Roseiarcus sp.]|jgi:CRP-like cAMP-binding protein